MPRGKQEIEQRIKEAREWFFREFGEELKASELGAYFSKRYEDERRRALEDRFESFHGTDLSIAADVCRALMSSPARPSRGSK